MPKRPLYLHDPLVRAKVDALRAEFRDRFGFAFPPEEAQREQGIRPGHIVTPQMIEDFWLQKIGLMK